MKRLSILIFGLAIILASCNKISDKPISEKLSTDELSKAIKAIHHLQAFMKILEKELRKLTISKRQNLTMLHIADFSNTTSFYKTQLIGNRYMNNGKRIGKMISAFILLKQTLL